MRFGKSRDFGMNMLGESVGNERFFEMYDHCDCCCGTVSESGDVEG